MNLAAAISLLQLALSLLSAVQGSANIPQSLIDAANKTATEAVAQAQLVLHAQGAGGEATAPVAAISNTTSVQSDTAPSPSEPHAPSTLGSAYDYSGSDAAAQLLHALNSSGSPLPNAPVPTDSGQPVTHSPASSNATCFAGSSTYQSGATVGCPDKPGAGVFCPLALGFSTWKCTDGTWVLSTPTATPAASCAYNGHTYAEGETVSAPAGYPVVSLLTKIRCKGGQWISAFAPSDAEPMIIVNPNTACTYSNTTLGAQCGGYYHCGFGVAGDYWSATLTSACTTAR